MILAIVQARMSSTRLPQKVLKSLVGKPMMVRQLDRVSRSKLINKIILATTNDSSDDILEKLCVENNISFYRGSLDDVLDRYYQCAKEHKPQIVVRITADCPLIDPNVIDEIISFYQKSGVDYASNTINPTYPDGLDVEVFNFKALERAWNEAQKKSEREHVTPYIHQNPDKFKLASFENKNNLSELRWTVDEPKDFELVEKIYENLFHKNPNFTTKDILNLLKQNPELLKINSNIIRNEGYYKSLLKD